MLKRLRLHLAGVCSLLTGIVFFILMTLNFTGAAAQYASMQAALFESTLDAAADRLLEDNRVDMAWLAETEASEHCVISLSAGGRPFFFSGAWTPPTDRGELLQAAEEAARAAGVNPEAPAPTLSGEPDSARFMVAGRAGDQYRGAAVVWPMRDESWLSLVFLKDRTGELRYLRGLLLRYALMGALVFAALCAVSWFLAGRALKPTAESLERQKAFIASASHELRSPVAVISASASAIRVEPAQTEEMLNSIESECALLTRLVDDLLLLANMDTASWRIVRQPVDLDALLIDTAEKLEPVARSGGFSLRLELPADAMPEVEGDAERIAQMITILVDNAVRHAGRPGVIEVRARRAGRTAAVEVIDHGGGIPPEEQRRVFDRFYSVSASRHDRCNFGLGLPIAAELARLHGGSISLAETPGGGCTFRIALPVKSG